MKLGGWPRNKPVSAKLCVPLMWWLLVTWLASKRISHVETQTMQTVDCRLQTVQTVQTVQTECYFFYLYLNFLVKLLLKFPASSHYVHCTASLSYVHWCVPARVMGRKWENHGLMFTGRCKSSFACFSLRRFHAGANTMEEGKLFLSVTVLYCHDYLIFFSSRSFFSLSGLK